MTPHCCSFPPSFSATCWCRERTAHWLHTVVELHLTQARWLCALIRNNHTSWLECFVFELLWLSAACCVVILLIIGLFISNSFLNLLSLLVRLVIPNSFFIEIKACRRVYLIAIHRVITLLHHYGYLWLKEVNLNVLTRKARTPCRCRNRINKYII